MPNRKRPDPKADSLRERGLLNPKPERISDELFRDSTFFDPRDLLQVKYEMLRRVAVDGLSVAKAAAAFGFSRPSFYEAQAAFSTGGLPGLLPKKRGPRRAHKLGADVMQFIEQLRAAEGSLAAPALVLRVQGRFGVTVHPRSLERALARLEKKRL